MKALLKKYYYAVRNNYYKLIYIKNCVNNFFIITDRLIKKEIKGDVPENSKERLCIFAHYDKYERIDDYVVYCIQKLYEIGCEIVMVSTSTSLLPGEIEKIKDFCSKIIIRKNIGIDFGSWKVGLSQIKDISSYKEVIFVNDSIYGPFFDLSKIFKKMEESGADIWGITDSWQHRYHIQSYFMVFNKRMVNSDFFRDFWREVRYFKNKNLIIKEYEIGLSQKAIQSGYKIDSYCKYKEAINFMIKNCQNEFPYIQYITSLKTKLVTYNPSHFLWDILIKYFGCPFLKIELLRDNPVKISNLHEMQTVLKTAAPDYKLDMIINHLREKRDR